MRILDLEQPNPVWFGKEMGDARRVVDEKVTTAALFSRTAIATSDVVYQLAKDTTCDVRMG